MEAQERNHSSTMDSLLLLLFPDDIDDDHVMIGGVLMFQEPIAIGRLFI